VVEVYGLLAGEKMEVTGVRWAVKRRRRGRKVGRKLAARTRDETKKMTRVTGCLRTPSIMVAALTAT